jgi:hypothetical protein
MKYKLYDNITSVNYNAQTKMIQINGKDYYYLGNSHSVSRKRPTKAQAAAKVQADQKFEEAVQFWVWVVAGIFIIFFLIQMFTNS